MTSDYIVRRDNNLTNGRDRLGGKASAHEFFCELKDALWGPLIINYLIGPTDELASFVSSQSIDLQPQEPASAFFLQSLSPGLCVFCKWPKEDSPR